MSKRTPLIAGNWKMNKTATEGVELVKEISAASVGSQASVNVVLCPPFTALSAVGQAIDGTLIALGAQNIHDKANGAFTGEISASMLRNLHVRDFLVVQLEFQRCNPHPKAPQLQREFALLTVLEVKTSRNSTFELTVVIISQRFGNESPILEKMPLD